MGTLRKLMNGITIKDFDVGDVCCLLVMNKGRNTGPVMQLKKVKTVGRKYVTLDDPWQRKFENGPESPYLLEHSDFGEKAMLFRTEAEAKEYVEAKEVALKIHNYGLYKFEQLRLDQLKRIEQILEEE